jgi:hypothetical protein
MKKRYFGVVRLTPEGDGVIDIVSEEERVSLRSIECPSAVGKSPS